MPRKVEVHRISGVLHATAGYRTFAYCEYAFAGEAWRDIWREIGHMLPTGPVLTCLWCVARIMSAAEAP